MRMKILSSRLADQRGMTLIEIIVVLVILSIVIGFLTQSVFSTGGKAKADLNKLKMQKVKGYVDMFRLRYNSLPSNLDELTRCTAKTGDDCTPITNPEELRDVWGNALMYNLDGSGRTYQIKTLGENGVEGGQGVDYDVVVKGP